MQTTPNYFAIDVAKDHLQVQSDAGASTLSYQDEALEPFIAQLREVDQPCGG